MASRRNVESDSGTKATMSIAEIREALESGGPEFQAAFREACMERLPEIYESFCKLVSDAMSWPDDKARAEVMRLWRENGPRMEEELRRRGLLGTA